MNIQRLKQLADFLQTIPANRFDLHHWRNHKDGSVEFDLTDEKLKHDCGTTACAVGWACSSPEFIEQGLYFDLVQGTPMFGKERSWWAIEAFFGLNYRQAQYLFSHGAYPGKSQDLSAVIDRINYVVQNGFPTRVFNYMKEEYEEL